MILRTPEDYEMLEVRLQQYAVPREHRAQSVARTAELEQVRRRLVEIDAEINIEAELAAQRLERKIRTVFPHARIAPLRRSHVEQRSARQETLSEHRDRPRQVLYRDCGKVLRVS